ncbi:uncharacterized protein CELE_M199.135 [Caenorhabditis elegans]|uniref:Uncharacterized protein n=1 Tax=Caenorhabditis elegans TaxID=6239 RepID=A0A078BPD2_CAEEL|nr:Uncharacterized protein CELE_M199.135 [Caenorhabditis elegans]CDX47413.1 Uncharacterized protein CELE_M199.135 [Caenorhabditis elegans]|eukprot:NP_001294093.1 Uncharacterized protein CELE_M199.135 [Caenorhabditis elegans]
MTKSNGYDGGEVQKLQNGISTDASEDSEAGSGSVKPTRTCDTTTMTLIE